MRMRNATDTRGFTLIEVMVSMVVLLIIIGLMATIFSDATKAWEIGTRRAENDGAGRAVIDLISRDLASAIGDDIFSYEVAGELGLTVYGGDKSDILFLVTLKDTNLRADRRYADEVAYLLAPMADATDKNKVDGRYRLIRVSRPAEECYSNEFWWRDLAAEINRFDLDELADATVIENVAAFEVDVYQLSDEYALPMTFEVYLELLDEKGGATAQLMHDGAASFGSDEKEKFLERTVRRYSARIHPHNYEGSRILRQ